MTTRPSLFFSFAILLLLNPLGSSMVSSNHLLSIESLSPSPTCVHSRADVHHFGLKLTDRHGPCFPSKNKMSRKQMLNQDQLRVNSLQSKAATTTQVQPSGLSATSSSIPVKSGVPLNTGNYVVTIGIGTPTLNQTVQLDTGSSLTWVQCQPCEGSCYPQQDPIFDPRTSATYLNISCTSTYCNTDIVSHSCFGSTCVYSMNFADGSVTQGYYAFETLTLTPTDSIPSFRFGCGEYNTGTKRTAGILALGRDPASLVSQTTSKYGGVFYYCVPPTSSTTGYLVFGNASVPTNAQYTSMLTHGSLTSYYFLELISISVAGTTLSIDPALFSDAGFLIDSGTVITRLPPTAYSALRAAFQSRMTQYPKSRAAGILDTCYDLRKYANVTLPSVALQLRGVQMDLDPSGIVWVASASQTCLAFAANKLDTDLGILGNTNQRRFSIIYDVPNLRIGFGRNGC